MQERIISGVNFAAAALLAAAVTMLAIQIFLRAVFSSPFAWAEEVVRYAFVWSVYLGAVLGLVRNTHIRVFVLVDVFGPKARRYSDIVAWIVSTICFAFLLYWSLDLAWKYRDASFYTLVWMPRWIFYMSVPITMALMLAFQLLPGRKASSGSAHSADL